MTLTPWECFAAQSQPYPLSILNKTLLWLDKISIKIRRFVTNKFIVYWEEYQRLPLMLIVTESEGNTTSLMRMLDTLKTSYLCLISSMKDSSVPTLNLLKLSKSSSSCMQSMS